MTYIVNKTKREYCDMEGLPYSMLWPSAATETMIQEWRGDEVIILAGEEGFCFYLFKEVFPFVKKEDKEKLISEKDDEKARIEILLRNLKRSSFHSSAKNSTLLVNNDKKEVYIIDKVDPLLILISGDSLIFREILTEEGEALKGAWIGDDIEYRKKMLKKYEKHYKINKLALEDIFTPAFIELAGWNE